MNSVNLPTLCGFYLGSAANQTQKILMGLFNTLMTKIFSHASAAVQKTAAVVGAEIPATPGTLGNPPAAAAAAPAQQVDVEATLDALAKKNSEDLDWKRSIVDLMKLVGMESSLTARKELAHDLHYTGDTNDSATMNMWLHKEVMKKLADNGAKIPHDLLKK